MVVQVFNDNFHDDILVCGSRHKKVTLHEGILPPIKRESQEGGKQLYCEERGFTKGTRQYTHGTQSIEYSWETQ